MTKVELSLRATNIKKVISSRKCPFAVVTLLASESSGKETRVLGRTEVAEKTSSPDWVKTFVLDYEIGQEQHFTVSIYDQKNERDENLQQQTEVGKCNFEVGAILGSAGNIKAKTIKSGLKAGGLLYASIDECASDKRTLSLELRGMRLKNVETTLFGKSDPFFEISAMRPHTTGDTWDVVYKSDFIRNTVNPKWDEALVSVDTICRGDLDRPIKISVFDYSKKGNYKPMGSFETSINGLISSKNTGKSFELRPGIIEVCNVKLLEFGGESKLNIDSGVIQPQKPSYGHSGLEITIDKLSMYSNKSPTKKPTFIDYLSGGCQLNLSVAIDFTGSNGDPRRSGTLHYIDPNPHNPAFNDYQKAISAIVPILEKYDSDKKIPVLGFGAKYGGVLQNCFQCGPNPEAFGTSGVLAAYNSVLKTSLTLSGPTSFIDIIRFAATRAVQTQTSAMQAGKQAYSILLILTDGCVSDVHATKQAIAQMSGSPLSIIIVGVGQADFSGMEDLDDGCAGRDIVQFVPFNRYRDNKNSLTAATLSEVPTQLVEYFSANSIQALEKEVVKDEDIKIEEDNEIDLKSNSGDFRLPGTYAPMMHVPDPGHSSAPPNTATPSYQSPGYAQNLHVHQPIPPSYHAPQTAPTYHPQQMAPSPSHYQNPLGHGVVSQPPSHQPRSFNPQQMAPSPSHYQNPLGHGVVSQPPSHQPRSFNYHTPQTAHTYHSQQMAQPPSHYQNPHASGVISQSPSHSNMPLHHAPAAPLYPPYSEMTSAPGPPQNQSQIPIAPVVHAYGVPSSTPQKQAQIPIVPVAHAHGVPPSQPNRNNYDYQ